LNRLSLDEHSHARHKTGLFALRIETQAQRVLIVVTHGAFCLPRRKRTERY
jgi:aminoglycoside phosphotransferase